jgi:ethanolamine utilization protein EutN
MLLGKVIGSVWSTKKMEVFQGDKLMIVQPVNELKEEISSPIIAVDTVDAGVGDFVFFATSREASIPLNAQLTPADATIVGVIDRIDI